VFTPAMPVLAPQPRPTTRRAAVGSVDLSWELTSELPDSWGSLMQRFDAGFFLSPLASVQAPPGATMTYAVLKRGNEPMGIAVVARTACRLSAKPRHAYLPTFPALSPTVPREAALAMLLFELRRAGVYEATLDSYDSSWQPQSGVLGSPRPTRHEYVIALDAPEGLPVAALAEQHRRNVSRGEKAGWRMEARSLGEGADALREVTCSAAARAAARGQPFDAAIWCEAPVALLGDADWGLSVFLAFREQQLLAGVLVGRTPTRGFYIAGGSTPEGYSAGAAAWLQWRVARVLAGVGVTAYNLGGVPAEAADDAEHPAHGLHRFKIGFGAGIAERHGLHWVGEPSHMTAHRMMSRLSQGLKIG
jgi:hypothetical protein